MCLSMKNSIHHNAQSAVTVPEVASPRQPGSECEVFELAPVTMSSSFNSTSIQKELPLLEDTERKNLMYNKRVVGKQGCDLIHLLRFNNDKRSCSIAKRTTHDHDPIFKEPIHKFSMFVPIRLFAYCLARCPGCARSP